MFYKDRNDRFYFIAHDTDFAPLLMTIEKIKSNSEERDSQKLYILYEKESLLGPLPNDIICNRAQRCFFNALCSKIFLTFKKPFLIKFFYTFLY
jgi:hypothetical protein